MLTDQPILGLSVPGRRVESQTSAVGWFIDDLLCRAEDRDGGISQIAFSCKSNQQVTANGLPPDFITNAWRQWRNEGPFNRHTDRLALVTRGPNVRFQARWHDLKQWCDQADPTLALAKVNESQVHRTIFDSVKATDGTVQAPTDEETVALIERLEVIPTDYQLTPSSWMSDDIVRVRTALSSQELSEAEDLWKELVGLARNARLGNGAISLDGLLKTLVAKYRLRDHPSVAADWERLRSIALDATLEIESTLSGGYHITREAIGTSIAEKLTSAGGCVVAGESGVGKSALVKSLVEGEFGGWNVTWFTPETFETALSESRRMTIGLSHSLPDILLRTSNPRNIIVIDAAERLKASTVAKAKGLLTSLAGPEAAPWHVIIISQTDALTTRLAELAAVGSFPRVDVPLLDVEEVAAALRSVPSLRALAGEDQVLPLLTNPQTLDWVMQSAGAFAADTGHSLTSTAEIADRLWQQWTLGRSALHTLLIHLGEREASYERSFAQSELDGSDRQAFDDRPPSIPLVLNTRGRIEFRHDLASDWSRFQRLKEVADDVSKWAPLAVQPLWINALRMLGQFLLRTPGQARHGWDRAFTEVQSKDYPAAADVLLDALYLDPHADRFLEERVDLLLANGGALLERLLARFFQIGTSSNVPANLAADSFTRLYLEAEMRLPIIGRWPPLARFLGRHNDQIGVLASVNVARLASLWLLSLPETLYDGRPFPYRDTFARLALSSARTCQLRNLVNRWWGGGGKADRSIYSAALAAAADLPDEVAAFALEMVKRRPLPDDFARQVKAGQKRAEEERIAAMGGPAAEKRQRRQGMSLADFTRKLPPWPLGPSARLDQEFRNAVLHSGGLKTLMKVRPAEAAEVILACTIDDHPTEDLTVSSMRDSNLGLVYDTEGDPVIFWKSPFFTFLGINSATAIDGLLRLTEFATDRWVADNQSDANISNVTLELQDGRSNSFIGGYGVFHWSQSIDRGHGQLLAGLSALEKWLIQRIEAGEAVEPLCADLLSRCRSAAILGVLVDVGKFQPKLFTSILRPLLGVSILYRWDEGRVQQIGLSFDSVGWARAGDLAFNMARDWAFAPHHKKSLQSVAMELAAENAELAGWLRSATAAWPRYDDARANLELRKLAAELDSHNVSMSWNESENRLVPAVKYPSDLRRAYAALQSEELGQANLTLLPYQCHQIIARNEVLDESSAAYLASLISEADKTIPDEKDVVMHTVAAAATLMLTAEDYLGHNPEIRTRAEATIRLTIECVGQNLTELRARDRIVSNNALRFAGLAALNAALKEGDAARTWDRAVMTVLTSRDTQAVAAMIQLAHRRRATIGAVWWRLMQLTIFTAALEVLTPQPWDLEQSPKIWDGWLSKLRRQSLGLSVDSAAVNPEGIAVRADRLIRLQWSHLSDRSGGGGARNPPDLPGSAGLNTFLMNAAFGWLLEYPEDSVAITLSAEDRALFVRLWEFEVGRIHRETKSDGDFALPSQLGYSILSAAPLVIFDIPKDEGAQVWRPILDIGAEGNRAAEHFINAWFLRLYKPHNSADFAERWESMIAYASGLKWGSGRRWYYSRRTLMNLLGITAISQLQHLENAATVVFGLKPHYQAWATSTMRDDEEMIANFALFLASPVGHQLRSEGLIWLRDAVVASTRLDRDGAGSALSELIDKTIEENATDLLADPKLREAAITIAAALTTAQIRSAMSLQQRLAALRD